MNSLHNSSIRLMPGGFCVSNGELINITPGADYDKRLEDAILEQKLNIGEHDLHCYVETACLFRLLQNVTRQWRRRCMV